MAVLNNRWLLTVCSWSWPVRFILTLALIASCIFIWYTIVYQPLHEKKMRLFAQLQGFYNVQELEEPNDHIMVKQSHEFNLAKETIALYQSSEHPGLWLQTQVDSLLAHVKNSGLSLSSCAMQCQIPKGWRTKYQLRIAMKGQLLQVQKFLEKVASVKELWSCKKISLTCGADLLYSIDATLDICKVQQNSMDKV